MPSATMNTRTFATSTLHKGGRRRSEVQICLVQDISTESRCTAPTANGKRRGMYATGIRYWRGHTAVTWHCWRHEGMRLFDLVLLAAREDAPFRGPASSRHIYWMLCRTSKTCGRIGALLKVFLIGTCCTSFTFVCNVFIINCPSMTFSSRNLQALVLGL